jgi:hypothetical protein
MTLDGLTRRMCSPIPTVARRGEGRSALDTDAEGGVW